MTTWYLPKNPFIEEGFIILVEWTVSTSWKQRTCGYHFVNQTPQSEFVASRAPWPSYTNSFSLYPLLMYRNPARAYQTQPRGSDRNPSLSCVRRLIRWIQKILRERELIGGLSEAMSAYETVEPLI